MNSQNKEHTPQIGEIYMMRFGGSANEQTGWRPGLVFQNNVGNAHSPNIIALPLTSVIKKAKQPTHVVVKASNTGLKWIVWFFARIQSVCPKRDSETISLPFLMNI